MIPAQPLLTSVDPRERGDLGLEWSGKNAGTIVIDDVDSRDGYTMIRRFELQQLHRHPPVVERGRR